MNDELANNILKYQLSNKERKVIIFMARCRVESFSDIFQATKHFISSTGYLAVLLKRICDKQLLKKENKGIYKFTRSELAEWIRTKGE